MKEKKLLALKLFLAALFFLLNLSCQDNAVKETPKIIQPSNYIQEKYQVIDEEQNLYNLLYQDKNFSEIEKRINNLLADQNDDAKSYALYYLYYMLSKVHKDTEIPLQEKVLSEWTQKNPNSHIPLLIKGAFYISYAWKIRGNSFASKVDKEVWPSYREKLELARHNLEAAYQLNPKDPNSSSNLIVVAKGLGLDKTTMEKYYQDCITAVPLHYGGRYNKLDYLAPKWHGSWEEMFGFAETCKKDFKEHPYLGLLLVEAYKEMNKRSGKKNVIEDPAIWPIIEEIYNNFFTKYPDNIRRRFFYVNSAFKANKFKIAVEQFEIIGDRWMQETDWASLKQFHYARLKSYYHYAESLSPRNALPLIEKAAQIDPYNSVMQFKLGSLYLKMEKINESEAALNRSLDLNPCNADALLNLCWIMGKYHHDYLKAQAYAEKALACHPNTPQKRFAKEAIRRSKAALKF